MDQPPPPPPSASAASAATAAHDVFITYAGPDKPHALDLRAALADCGLRAFVDAADLALGNTWDTVIPAALAAARMVIVLVGPGWKDGETWYAPEEVAHAIAHCRARPTLRVVPLRMRDTADAPLPYGVARLVGINDADADWTATAGRLAAALAGRASLGGPLPAGRIEVSLSRLPRGGPHFFGRQAELAALHAAWRDPGVGVVSLAAMGGAGKSALVRRWLNDMQARGWDGAERVFGWSFVFQGSDAAPVDSRDPAGAARDSADRFVDEMARWLGDKPPPGLDPWQKAERLVSWIRRRPTLLVLDGIEPMQHPSGPLSGVIRDPSLATLLKELADGMHGLCVVTSRVALTELRDRGDAVQHRALDRLDETAGVALLDAIGVRGGKRALEEAVTAYRGHALALNLLGTYLTRAWSGSVRRRDRVPRIEAVEGGEPAKAVMVAYERWFEAGKPATWWQRLRLRFRPPVPGPEVAILRLMGLFDRPAEPEAIAAVRDGVSIRGLTDAFAEVGPEQWAAAVVDLRALGLLERAPERGRLLGAAGAGVAAGRAGAADDADADDAGEDDAADDADAEHADADAAEAAPGLLDAHPLVREHFGARLRDEAPKAWQAGHERLYRHFAGAAEEQPATLAGMEPLFRAVLHGCAAGRYEEALDEVYWRRIRRGNEGYTVHELGAFAADLAALAGFFVTPWQRPQPTLTAHDQAAVLGWAGFGLRALGRLAEAVVPFEAGLARRVEQADWKNAAADASNLAELLLTLGRLGETSAAAPGAVERAREAVAHADRSGDGFLRMVMRTTLADALHQRGHTAEARALFVEAERLQVEQQPRLPLLYSLQGYRYGDLLLTLGEPADAWRRAEWMVCQPWTSLGLLSHALHRLLLGRAALAAAPGPDHPDFALARHHLDAAVTGLRKAGTMHEQPRALLARAALHRRAADWPTARRDLAEAHRIATRGGMRLFLVDHQLESARLHLATGDLPAARAAYSAARAEVEAMGYHRRDPELAELAAALEPAAPA